MGFGDKFLFELDRIWRLFAKFDCGNIKDANEVIFVTFFMFGGVVGLGPRVVVGIRDTTPSLCKILFLRLLMKVHRLFRSFFIV